MILVTLGTQKQDFSRLLKYIEESNIKDEIIVQAGYTKFESKKMKIFDFISYEKMEEYIKKADLIITHAGTGSVLTPLKYGKKVIVCSRLSKYGEHVDDHQQQLTEVLSEAGYVLELNENNKLDDLLKKIKTFKPQKYESNNDKFIENLKKEIDSFNKKNKSDIFFIIIVLMILCLGIATIIRKPKEMSLIENRNLAKFENFKLKDFLDGSFQDNLEDALSDQFIGGETIKKTMKKLQNSINALNAPRSVCENEYVSLGGSYYTFNCENYILIDLPVYDNFDNWYIKKRVNEFNSLNKKIDVYYYIINRGFNYNFKDNTITSNLKNFLKDNLVNYKGLDDLKVESFEKYKKFFYKTDHHWNALGSYEGYRDIANMFGFIPKKPKRFVTFEDTIFYGSEARNIAFYDIKEKFSAFEFEYNKHNEYVNGSLLQYGKYPSYFAGIYSNSPLNQYYMDFYGPDVGEVKYDYSNQNKDNLLILSSSFSNPINPLIASHFNKTYIVDLRHYENFIIDDYLKKNDINKVLFIMDYNFIKSSEFEIGE